jgi:hypothetical protein
MKHPITEDKMGKRLGSIHSDEAMPLRELSRRFDWGCQKQADSPDTQLLWDVHRTAKEMSLCEKTLWKITQPRGDLPCVRVFSRVFYSSETIREWIKKQENAQ